MAKLTIRNLDERTQARLRERAAIRARFRLLGGVELKLPPRD